MLNMLADVAPKSVVAAVVVWAGANYLVIAPEIASRVVLADHLPVCESNYRNVALAAADERAKSIPLPSLDAAQELALGQLREFQNNPMMNEFRRMSGGLSDMFGIDRAADLAVRQYEEASEAAKLAYEEAQERLKRETATEIGKAGDICGCVADAAIGETRTEWAIFSGTLGLIHPAPLKTFDERMAQMQRSGRCSGGKVGQP